MKSLVRSFVNKLNQYQVLMGIAIVILTVMEDSVGKTLGVALVEPTDKLATIWGDLKAH